MCAVFVIFAHINGLLGWLKMDDARSVKGRRKISFTSQNMKLQTMKIQTMKLQPLLRASLMSTAFCSAVAPVHAGSILNFGGTGYVTGGDEHLEGDTIANRLGGNDKYGDPIGVGTTLSGRAFSSSTAFSPTSGYTGPVFYGGGSVTATDGADNEGFHELSVRNGGGVAADSIHWRVDANGTTTHTNHVFVFFEKDQFEEPWASGGSITSAQLADATFRISTGQVIQSGPSDISNRWVVQDGSTFWVSNTFLSIEQNTPYQTSFASITGWAQYDPTSGLAALDFDEGSTFAAHTFTDVQGFGFYVEHENGADVTQVDIGSFSVIPEPSQFFLAGASLVSLLIRRRRR
jgi:hypothetical protein